MTNSNWENEEIARAVYRNMNAEYVKEYFKEPLEGTIHYEGERAFLVASDDLLMLLVFTYIDLMGYLYKGGSKSIYAVEFMREYLGRVDNRYEEVSGLLYDALRHGKVHLGTPKRIKLQDGEILDFLFIRSGEREDFLKVAKRQEMQSTGIEIDIYRLSLDLPLIYKDLLSAIDTYAEDIRGNQLLSDAFSKSFKTRRDPERATENELLKKSYIQGSDFDFVRRQISNLHPNPF